RLAALTWTSESSNCQRASDFHATKCHRLWLRLRFYCSHDPHRHQLRHHRRRADHLLPSNCCHLGGYWLETAKVSNMNEQLQEHAPKESLTGFRGVFFDALERLSHGYFALVMGTCIVSVGLYLVGFEALSTALLWIAAVSYVVLWVLYVWRAISHRQAMLHDLRGPELAFAYFTVVA